ncbi:hypothetical protein [Nodularia sphaerocarpa]|uniref:hypothetical protein n=1 Tax=Nodularia sphaerocarpa TaxID=137816 RepID=UPI001EFBFFB1|nr:hypothetical protein [Nodularia sphaerocarpa]MDB9374061.1 hypothetical protein [Nodularia sphaerocarpa CS-585]ULP71452.1 hypothetical protein BDGGKGIB_01078 [Nodularia sphaerocarpa UHCC 0038]
MSNAYIIKTYRSPESVKNYLDTLLKDFTKADYQFFVHVYNSTLVSFIQKEDGWSPISAKLIREHWGKTKIQLEKLQNAGLLEIKVLDEIELADGEFLEQTYSRKDGLCRCYRTPLEIMEEIENHSPNSSEEYTTCQYYNLMKGEKMNTQVRCPKNNENRKPHPKLILEAMNTINKCVVNLSALEAHVDKLDEESFWGTDKDYRAFVVDRSCLRQIRENHTPLENGLAEYQVMFKDPQMSGRLTELGSGMQGCSREMKKQGFSGIPGIKNYDLKSSQVYGLIQWFERANIDTSWLHEYLSQDKQIYADKVGISKDRWKQCFMALIMGGHLQKTVARKNFEVVKVVKNIRGQLIEQEDYPNVAVIRALCQEAKGDADLALSYYQKFAKVVAPLKICIDAWQEWLLTDYFKYESFYGHGKQLVVNKTGKTFNLTEYQTKGDWDKKKINELKRRISAFFLQGTEAAYIHHLTVISEHFGYRVLSNQHDGLVTIGEIPQEAMDIAKRNSGLKYAYLEEKAFV